MSNETKIIGGVVVGLVACCCLIALAMMVLGGLFVFQAGRVFSTEVGPFITEIGPVLTEASVEDTPTPKPVIITTPVPTPLPGARDTLDVLENAIIPPSDLREIAMRLKGISDIPEIVNDTPADHALGTELEFRVGNTETSETVSVMARLIYKTENVYFFADTSAEVNDQGVQDLVDKFQEEIYPTNREFFGSEWNPGVDGDPHVYILYARNLGSNAFTITAGYYSSADEYSRLAHEFSNEKEMFYLNADYRSTDDPIWLSTLAHEFQHMIHWAHDRNEETWMNEGMSDLAETLNGYDVGSHDDAFVADPDLQLTAWTEGGPNDNTIPHYGAAFMFLDYFLDRFGNEATQALVADPANGLRAVEDVLQELNITDSLTNQPITAIDVFADWVVTNYLRDDSVADGRYTYHNYPEAPEFEGPTDAFRNCPLVESATVHQFAADYYEINCSGSLTINFTGSQQVQVIPASPHSGRYAFWSHRNDESDTRLTQDFDLTELSQATLTYWTWYAIEEDYDYVYLVVSADDGATWKILETPSGTDKDPTGNNLDWGYTANSGGGNDSEWVKETVDLSDYAGQKISVRFEYVTDAAVNRAGFLLDDIAIPELDYVADFEDDDGGWEGEGFVRMDNFLPQKFVVQAIIYGDETRVEPLPLSEANTGTLTVELGAGDRVVLVVSGITPFTTELASYEFEVK